MIPISDVQTSQDTSNTPMLGSEAITPSSSHPEEITALNFFKRSAVLIIAYPLLDAISRLLTFDENRSVEEK